MLEKDKKAIITLIKHLEKVLNYVGNMTEEEFIENSIVIDAVILRLMQIGEVAKHQISQEIKTKKADIPWHDIYGFRNRIVHDYVNVNPVIVFQIIRKSLPELLHLLRGISLNEVSEKVI